jgi:hypothetical protein
MVTRFWRDETYWPRTRPHPLGVLYPTNQAGQLEVTHRSSWIVQLTRVMRRISLSAKGH